MNVEHLVLSGFVFINTIIIFKIQGQHNTFTYPRGACILNKVVSLSIKCPKGQPAESNTEAFFNINFILVYYSDRGIPLQTWNFPSSTSLEQVGVLSAPCSIQEASPTYLWHSKFSDQDEGSCRKLLQGVCQKLLQLESVYTAWYFALPTALFL